MEENKIRALQISALSRINYCFYELKKNPPLEWINNVIDKESISNTRENFSKMNMLQQAMFSKELFNYLDRESTTEARIMLIINYLFALLIKSSNNRISIHKNFDIDKINKFTEENSDLINRLKRARNKLYAHIDLDWIHFAKGITFDEIQKCIDFLNNLFNYPFDSLLK